MAETPHDDELRRLLREECPAPPLRKDFVKSLRCDLRQRFVSAQAAAAESPAAGQSPVASLPRTVLGSLYAVIAITAGAVAVVLAVAFWLSGPQEPEAELALTPQPSEYGRGEGEETDIRSGAIDTDYGVRANTVPLVPDWALPGGTQHGEDRMSIWVARSSAIARCTIVEMPEEGKEGIGLCKVERVIYGKLPEEQIRLYLSHARLGATRVFFLSAIPPEAEAEVDYSVPWLRANRRG